MKNLLLMRVTGVMPHVDLSEIDLSMEALSRVAQAMPEGGAKIDMKIALNRLLEQREAIRSACDQEMVHVEFIDADSPVNAPVGAANFLVPPGDLKMGATYQLAVEEVMP